MKIKLFLLSVLVIPAILSFVKSSEEIQDDIQIRLNKGEHPRDIMKSGVPMDSLYAKFYQGGHIFYFFPKDSSGIVLGPKNLHYLYDTNRVRIYWSCRNKLTGATSAAVGAGPKNTQLIKEAECTLYDPDEKRWMTSAGELCLAYKGGGYTDWFLPSKDELHQACLKLSQSGKLWFNDKTYWSSTEVDTVFAWVEHFRHGPQEFELFGQSGYRKYFDDYVRPARIFK